MEAERNYNLLLDQHLYRVPGFGRWTELGNLVSMLTSVGQVL